MDATKPFATCVECLIDYYGPILGTAKDATGHLYLCRPRLIKNAARDEYECVVIEEAEVARVKADIQDDGFGGASGDYTAFIFKRPKIILWLTDSGKLWSVKHLAEFVRERDKAH